MYRFGFFIVLGYLANISWVSLFDGDQFWGWSTGFCLALPALLVNAGRKVSLLVVNNRNLLPLKETYNLYVSLHVLKQVPVREVVEFNERMAQDFREFGIAVYLFQLCTFTTCSVSVH